MRGSERSDPKNGPLESMSQAAFGGFDRVAKAYEPALKGVAQYNLELSGLMARRMRAWFEIPAALTRSKTPHDLLGEQMKFWQTAVAQYMQSQQKLVAALAAFAVVPAFDGAQSGKGEVKPRDFITFPDAPEPSEATEQERADRRAA
jgi:hypothetical protein